MQQMKKCILFVFFGLMLITLTSMEKKGDHKKNDFKYVVALSPAFSDYGEIIISKSNGIGQIKITLKDKYQTKIIAQNSTALNESDFEYFNTALNGVSLKTVKTELKQGLDGILVKNSYYEGNINNTFRFWSPAKGTKECQIIESVIGLSKRKFATEEFQDYFESLKKYYGY
jgi:hypothetical protein